MKYPIILIIWATIVISSPALAGGGESIPSSPAIPTPTPLPLPSSTNFIQQNITPAAISPTSCSNVFCLFVNGQTNYSNNGQTNNQVSVGAILQLPSSSERANADLAASNAESNRANTEIAKNRANQEIIDSLRTQLLAAIEKGESTKIIAIAIELAPKVGYSDYRVYLKTITSGKFIAP